MSTNSSKLDVDPTLYQALPEICLILDSQGYILAVSQSGTVFLGYSTAELVSQPISNLIAQSEQIRWKTLIDQSSQRPGEISHWSGELIGKNGKTMKVQVNAWAILPALSLPSPLSATLHHQPAILGLICQDNLSSHLSPLNECGISAEITSKCEKYFHAIFNQTLQWLVLLKPNGTVIQANQTALKLGGLSQEQVQGCLFWECQWWANLVHSSLSPTLEGEIDESLKSAILRAGVGEPVQFEVEIVDRSNQNIILNFLIQPILDEAGQVTLLIAQNQDITDSKRSEVALRESEERYRSVIAAMAEGIVLQDAQGVVQACNVAAERILGLSADQIMGRVTVDPRWRTIHEDGSPFKSENHPLAITLRTGRPCQNVVMGICKPDQTLCWISMNSQPLFAPAQSKPYAAISSFTEITERKQAERERLIATVTQRIRRSLNLQATLDTTVAEIRQLLQTDRVIIFRFEPSGEGLVVVESVSDGWPSILGTNIYDPCFLETCVDYYRQGNIRAVEDIHTAHLSPCHIELLSQFQVQANLVVPILQQHEAGESEYLWGLLIAHQCRSSRLWQQWEQELLQQLTEQVAIAIQQAQLYQQLESANQELQRLAVLDGLTLVANRRRFDDYLEQQWQQLKSQQDSLSLILGDIDCFKPYNDTYGHQAGDACLKQVAEMIQKTAGQMTNLVARYGGEEFAVILPQTQLHEAVALAQAIRNNIRTLQIPHRHSSVATIVTMSLGVAGWPAHHTTPVQLIAAADMALYQAKTKGRDQVVAFSHLD